MIQTLPTIAANWALFLDVDGTLLDFAPRPDEVQVPETLRRTLADLSDLLDGAVAFVSGRSLADVDRIFAPLRLPVAGQHGAEARRGEDVEVFAPASPALSAILLRLSGFVSRHPAIRIEHKGLSVAIHYRGVEELRGPLGALLAEAMSESGPSFELYAGHLVYDLKPRAFSKGSAIDWFMAAPPFAGRVPVFVGDDRTDEDGFVGVMARGGLAIKVGLTTPTIAPWRLASPEAVREWLEASAARLISRQPLKSDLSF